MTLGQNIARLRAQKNLSQGDLADALEVSRQSVSKWETDASIPELDKLLRLAELFGVTLDELVKGESAQPEAARGEAPDKESAGAYTAATPAARRETRQIVGTILLCFGALIGILIMLFAGTLAGFILALPLFVCGTICLTVRRRTGALVRVGAVYRLCPVYALRYGPCGGEHFPHPFMDCSGQLFAAAVQLDHCAPSSYNDRLHALFLPRTGRPLGKKKHRAACRRLARAFGQPLCAGPMAPAHCGVDLGAEPLLANRAVQYARFDQRFCRGRAPRSHRSALARLAAEPKQNKIRKPRLSTGGVPLQLFT